MNFNEYTNKKIEEVLRLFNSSLEGLSENEAKIRLEKYGTNEVKSKEIGLFNIFLRQFKSSFFYLLLIASLIAFLIGEKIDGFLILIFVLINVSLGFFQEAKAYNAISLLKKYLPLTIRVLREGKEKTINKSLLVPGDIVLLETGNIVPADLRIIKTKSFLVDESILTGESFPVEKTSDSLLKETKEIFKAKNILFAGTSVISGKAKGVVIGTGKNTVFGEIAKISSETPKESSYEKNIINLSQKILKIVSITIIFIFLLNLIIKGTVNFLEFSLFCIALIVSILPEALPLIVTFSLSRGSLRLAKEKVVVKRLSAVEDLGNIDILCTDKTGTITENQLTLKNIYSPNKNKCLLYGLLSSSYVKEEIESGFNPFDLALFEKSSKEIISSLKEFKIISELPFENLRLRNSVLLKDRNQNFILITRGAPEVILKLCSNIEDNQKKEIIKKEMEKEGKEGKRILAIAYKPFNKKSFSVEDEKELTFLGYFSFFDPLKKTAPEAIKLAERLNLNVKILTGDSPEVAGQVAKEIGLVKDSNQVITGEFLESLSEENFEKFCQDFSVFARVSPQTKHKIVKTLQKKYEVGFLGEGINDVPALKAANVAIAVKEATDISRQVSDIVLLKKDLKVIINGIKEGRYIFSNINKYIKYALASNFGNFYSVAIVSLFTTFLPMLPVQILLGNLLSDFPVVTISTDRVDLEELKRPRLYQVSNILSLIILLALVSSIFDFVFFAIFYKAKPEIIQTLWFIESILTEIFLIFSIRTRRFFLKAKRPSFTLIIFSLLDILLSISLPFTNFGQEFFHFIIPPTLYLFIVILLALFYLLLSEIVKLIYFQYKKPFFRKIDSNLLQKSTS